MSFSVNYIGTPDKIIEALKKESERLTGDSKKEFDAALPALTSLVGLNYNDNFPVALKLTAFGHAYKSGDQNYGNVSVNIENIGTVLL